MTDTGRWFDKRRRELLVRDVAGVSLGTAGAVLLALTLGVVLGRVGLYRTVPVTVVFGWLLVAGVVGVGVYVFRRRSRALHARTLAESVEQAGGLRRGVLVGIAAGAANGSDTLLRAADRKNYSWLQSNGRKALDPMRVRGARSIWSGVGIGIVGASVFVVSNPADPVASRFWRPFSAFGAAGSAVTVTVDRMQVRRGETVTVTIVAEGRESAQLYTREPGESWTSEVLALDPSGSAVVTLGPLSADQFVRAEADGRTSETVRVRVEVPAFLADLSIYARFPEYLERIDEVLQPGDSVLLPAGTQLLTTGRATVELSSVQWESPGNRTHSVAVEQNEFQGRTSVAATGVWRLAIRTAAGVALDDVPPELFLTVVADSIPVVVVPLPGVDTVAPASLRQSIVVDAHDDHGLTLIEAISRRAGDALLDARVDTLLLPDAAADRAVLSWVLDLNGRGFEPGDTAFYRVRAFDNSPARQRGETREFALRLPSQAEMRQAIRDATDQLAADADSLRARQEQLTQETESLAATQERAEDERANRNDEGLDFSEAEKASEVAEEQTELLAQADSLAQQLQEIAESAWEAGMTDPEWHRQLAELQEMLEQSITPEMMESLEDLQDALERLDPQAMQEALQRMAEQQQQLQEQFERSQELFERAAMEGAMSTLAEDAEEIAERQEELNRSMESGEVTDSAAAVSQDRLALDTEELQRQLDELQNMMQQAGEQTNGVEQSEQQAGEAAQQMQQGAQQSREGQSQSAQQSGEQAAQQLESIPEDLRQQLEEMRGEWRDEVLEQMDMALTETAEIARRQSDVASQMQRGETGAEMRGEQAALRQSIDQVIQRLQDAAGKNALVSPELSTALDFSRLRMTEALEQFEQPTPNTRQASQFASEALDGLNAVAAALMRNRSDVEGSESGSGMAEAMQQMAQMAAQQEALNAESGGVLPLMPQGGEQLLQQLQQLAEQQQNIGEDLEELAAQEALPGGAEEMAEEALEIAQQLAEGRLDAETLERQEELFKKLLDAGRSLRSDEEDEREERQSVTAEQSNLSVPPALDPSATGPGLRYPYPTWDQLRKYSAAERRIILNYFRRLNTGRP